MPLTTSTTPLRSVENIWDVGVIQSTSDPLYYIQAYPRITETKATLNDSNQVSRQTFIYGQYNNQTDVYEYNYGTGAPPSYATRHTHTDYLTVNPVNGQNYSSDFIYLLGLPTQQKVYDENGIERARTTYEYDGYNWDGVGMTARPGIIGMETGYGTSYTTRGNLTKATRLLLASTGPVTADTGISSYSQYDVAGNVVKARDPKGNDTTFDYSDSFSGSFTPNTFAFLKSATSPAPATTYGGGVPLVSSSIYDFQSGKVVSTTDPNGNVTSVEYNDPLDRLTRVVRPSGGGETTYEYGDGVGNLYLRTRTKQSNSVWLEDYALFDGLGRAKRSAHNEGTPGWSVSETQYDALGRVSQVSNPFWFSDTCREDPYILWLSYA